MTSVVTPVFIRRNSAEFLIQKIPDAHLLLNSRVDQRQVIACKVHGFDWSMMINSLLEKAFPVAPNIIHIIEFCKQCHIGSHLRTKEWNEEQENSFQKLKQPIASTPVLASFDNETHTDNC